MIDFKESRKWNMFKLATIIVSLLSRHPCQATELLTEATLQAETLQDFQYLRYGVDVSFPMHHHMPDDIKTSDCGRNDRLKEFALDRLDYYKNHFLKGCRDAFGEESCRRSEDERIEMSKRQPATMKNMTKGLGFHKMKLPPELFARILEFWHQNQHQASQEGWPAGSTYLNHWESMPWALPVDNITLLGGGYELTQLIWDGLLQIISEWTGQELQHASMYGIRIYRTNAVLATHVDRNPLISSAIINVAQDIVEPWPLEVIGHDGFAYNVTMEPGDLVLYESHSILHGRPFPLQGKFMANLFVHFEPISPDAKLHDLPIYKQPMKPSKNFICVNH